MRLKGEDPNNQDDFNAQDSFIKAKLRRKIIILVAGVAMNFLVARLLFSFIFWQGTKPISLLPENALKTDSHSYLIPTFSFLEKQGFTSGSLSSIPAKVDEVLSGNLASTMGIISGDILKTINGDQVNVANIGTVLKADIGKNIKIVYLRGKKTLVASGVCGQDDCILGISFSMGNDVHIKDITFPLGRAMLAGLQEIGAETRLTFNAL